MKIAIIGSGIAGNVAAYHLRRNHDITVFEAGDYVGGHTNTIDVEEDGRCIAVDTGFIVFNDRTYPDFIRLLDELEQPSKPSVMSFSVQNEASGLEYNGSSLNALFTQRRNVVRPRFWHMVRDILRSIARRRWPSTRRVRLKRSASTWQRGPIRRSFCTTISVQWRPPSGRPSHRRSLICRCVSMVRFFSNHGLLQLKDRPQWRVVEGGSREYVRKLTAGHRDRIRLSTPVESISRLGGQVQIRARGLAAEQFDHVFIACHSDQALRLLADPTPTEREVLGAIPYQENEAVTAYRCEPDAHPSTLLGRRGITTSRVTAAPMLQLLTT